MGSGIGMWLLYRAGDGGLAFSSLVVPPGAQTPVHDHLAWGLVGLYRGSQDEDVYPRHDDGDNEERAELAVVERRSLVPGDIYELLPENDIHRVRTTSDGHVGLAPPARQRQRLHLAAPLPPGRGARRAVQVRLAERAVRERVVGAHRVRPVS